jgi:AmiR/NasT family two-component response regulator
MMANSLLLSDIKIVVQMSDSITSIVLNRVLSMFGCTAIFVSGRARATREVIQRIKPDMVLLEIDLDEVDRGYQTARAVTESGICLVIVTAEPQVLAQELARSLGAAGHVCKPFDSDRLVSILETAMYDHYMHTAESEYLSRTTLDIP